MNSIIAFARRTGFYLRISVLSVVLMTLQLGRPNYSVAQTKDTQLWNAAVIEWNFTTNWLTKLKFDYNRQLSDGPVWRQYAIQPTVEYYPSNNIDLFTGVFLSDTRQTETNDTKEIRPLIGFRWNIIKPEKRVFFRLQTKYEYRYFISTENESKDASRIRIKLDLFIPITQKSYHDDKALYALIWSEVFTNFQNGIKERYQSKFRQYLGLGYRFSFAWRFEMSYVFQASRNSLSVEDIDAITNSLQLTLKYYISNK